MEMMGIVDVVLWRWYEMANMGGFHKYGNPCMVLENPMNMDDLGYPMT